MGGERSGGVERLSQHTEPLTHCRKLAAPKEKLLTHTHCRDHSSPTLASGFPCKRYEGSCRPERSDETDGDCTGTNEKWRDPVSNTIVETGSGDICGAGTGPKYGYPKGTYAASAQTSDLSTRL